MATALRPAAEGRIGPNAVLQLVPVLRDEAGEAVTAKLLARAGVIELPDPEAGLMEGRRPARPPSPGASGRTAGGGPPSRACCGPRHGRLHSRPPDTGKGANPPAPHACPTRGPDPRPRGGETRLDLLRLGRVSPCLDLARVFEIADNPVVRGATLGHTPMPLARGGVRAALLRALRPTTGAAPRSPAARKTPPPAASR